MRLGAVTATGGALVLGGMALWSGPAAAQGGYSVTAPSSGISVAAARDFATEAFQDPWDMSQRSDVGWFLNGVDQPLPGLTNSIFSGGIFTVTTSNTNPNFYLLESGNPNAARIGKFGTLYPIDASTFRVIAFRMSAGTPSSIQLLTNQTTIYDGLTTVFGSIATSGGWRTYIKDIPSEVPRLTGPLTWSGTVGALRFDPSNVAGDTLMFDWVRLVERNPSLCRTITWTGSGNVDIYLDNDNSSGNGTLGPVALGVGASGNNSGICGTPSNGYPLYVGALAPGRYYVAIRAAGSGGSFAYSPGYYDVNATPTLTFTSPSEEGSSDDFATVQLGNAWDMDATTDFDRTVNVTGAGVTTMNLETEGGTLLPNQRVYYATSVDGNVDQTTGSTVGDPYLYTMWATGRGLTNRIDPARYRILTLELGLPNKPRHINAGSIARIVWRVAGDTAEAVSDDIIVNSRGGANVLDKFVLDMADRSVLKIEQGSTLGWVAGSSANPGIDLFRIDPHEFTPATPFYVKRIKLAALEKANSSYTIRWAFSEASGTVSLYRDADRAGFNGTLIASNVSTGSTGSYVWNTSGVGNGTYYIYAVMSDGINTNRAYARWPVVVDHAYTQLQTLIPNRTALNFGVTGYPNQKQTSTQTVGLNASGSGPVPCWQVDKSLSGASSQFISISPTTGTGSGSFGVTLVGNPPAGLMTGTLRISNCSSGAGFANSPQYVRFYIRTGGSAAPIGTMDTPLQGATGIIGSIPVTGWALDDLEVTRVLIYRDAFGTEPPGTQIYVGDAVLVEGARPDVEATFPSYPFNYRGGWGYLLLTNMLPSHGNGTFTLRAYARDVEGHSVLLGARSFTGDNASATRPFGAIDTPGQGGVASGGSFVNFGWALTPQPRMIPTNGSTIGVVVDGVVVGHPGTLGPRADIQALFPGYANTNAAVGAFFLNTTGYANGVHTIAWSVTDDGGRSEGIGSRYFNIQNSGVVTAESTDWFTPSVALAAPIEAPYTPAADARSAADSAGAVWARVGYDAEAPLTEVAPAGGRRTIVASELERVEIHLSAPGAQGEVIYDGHLVVGSDLRPLPIGTTLDRRRGIFYWQPGVAFIGTYDLLFTRSHADGSVERIPVSVTLAPKNRSESDVRLQIDAPVPGEVSQPFLVGGWAFDTGAAFGTGVDTIHVWAYPVTARGYGEPFFLGAAQYGDARPDVGAAFGRQYTPSAYGLTVRDLAPGTYDIAVFPHSSVTAEFAPARVVRVTVR